MSPFPWSDFALLIALILLNGIFAMSELAIVSARPAQLRMAADRGSSAARTALELAADPGKFLSTVQIGITLVGIVNGAISGAALGGPVGERLELLGVPADMADNAGFALVIAVTTYLSLIIGELVPKQFALRASVPVAMLMARPMALIARVAAPFVWLLDKSSSILLRVLGMRASGESALTAEELQMMFTDASHLGVIGEQERTILSGVMRLNERPVRELMTPRTELDWIDLNADENGIRATIDASPHSRLPVADATPDKVVGVVKVREVLALLLAGETVRLDQVMRKAEIVPDQLDAMDALGVLQASGTGMVLVHDEYGHFEGIVTPADLLSAMAGGFASHQDEGDQPLLTERADGSLLVAGSMSADALAERLGIELSDTREFGTAAGYILWLLKRLPIEGETCEDQGWRFEVVDMDGRRIDKLLVSQVVAGEA
ncbi:DNA-binding protein [Croceibacterium mercuriale]|uniref:DNA-binding protein n=1 Tax=Croceibacterium mercuriale TaxID=1572751 RepID=A0A0B2BY71_9SPHN|nr:hemolysin family protein [Croceibacterium mercuriale]KHL24626.1 DNA-binding protein [Croceibacterium mercuriale]